MFVHIYAKQQRFTWWIWGDFLLTRPWWENQVKHCSNGNVDFPHSKGNLNEENTFHKQTSFMYHQVIASTRSAVLKTQDHSLQSNLLSQKRRWNLQCKSSVQNNDTARLESCFIGQNYSSFVLLCFFSYKPVKLEPEGHCLWHSMFLEAIPSC